MILRLHSRAVYELPTQTFILLMIEPPLRGQAHQVLDESLITTPTPRTELWNDIYGNPQRRFVAPEGQFSFEFSARVEVEPNEPLPNEAVEHPPYEIPAECMIYTVQSRYCQSDKLTRLALSEFGQMPSGGSRVNAIANWINQKLEYQYGTSDAMTDAFVLPRAWDSGALCFRLLPRIGATRFSCLRAGLSKRKMA
jgi:transglutaminase-like putative cysteine protease